MNDYIKIKLVAWTAEIEHLKAEIIYYDAMDEYEAISDKSDRLREINQEILKLLGENEKRTI